MKQVKLNNNNIFLYAAKNYINPRLLSLDEFKEDFSKFKYLKKLLTRYYNKGELQERLILNHIINIYNVFERKAATEMCKYKIEPEHWPALKTFLLYLNLINETDFINISTDFIIAQKLQDI